MSWIKEVEAINKRRELASQQGGEESVARHHAKGFSLSWRLSKVPALFQ